MAIQKPSVLVLMGGPDAEGEVSICSGKEVAQALRASVAGVRGRYEVVEKIINKPTFPELMALSGGCDVIFPALHGYWGEGGPLQEELEKLGKPYVGSQPNAAKLAMDKMITKSLVSELGVPTPAARQLNPEDACDLAPPIVIKPVDDGSSLDLRICYTHEQIAAARAQLHPKRGQLMVEKYIKGREITVGILCGEPLPLIEIIPGLAVEFYDYDAKYNRDDTKYVIDPQLPPGVADRCTAMSMTAYDRLGCRDIARVDIMIDEQGPWFLEINTMPGFTTHSLVPMAARKIGLEMPALCATLVEAALARHGTSRDGTARATGAGTRG